MKFCISVGLAKVKVGLLLRVMNTLLELMVIFPVWTREAELEAIVVESDPELGTVGLVG
jgi:hypothetical protein